MDNIVGKEVKFRGWYSRRSRAPFYLEVLGVCGSLTPGWGYGYVPHTHHEGEVKPENIVLVSRCTVFLRGWLAFRI